MNGIQEKTFGYFTEEDWLEIKEYIKEVLKEDIHNVITEEYIFDIDYIRELEKDYIYDCTRDIIKEVLKDQEEGLKKVIREVIREVIKNEFWRFKR